MPSTICGAVSASFVDAERGSVVAAVADAFPAAKLGSEPSTICGAVSASFVDAKRGSVVAAVADAVPSA